MATDFNESSPPSAVTATKTVSPPRSGVSPVAAALVAAGFGMGSCRAGLELMAHQSGDFGSQAARVALLLVPFALGAVVTAVVYRLFMRRTAAADDQRATSATATSQPATDPARAPKFRVPGTSAADVGRAERGSAALTVFFAIAGISTGIGALLAAMFMGGGGDGGPLPTTGDAIAAALDGAWQGGVIGLGFGLLLAVPTALVVWLVGARR